VNEWLRHILNQQQVIAPVRGAGGDEMFAPITSPDEVLWTFENPLGPPKQFLLPQTDPLARFRRASGHYEVEALPPPEPRVLFNVRSCDATGLAYLRQTYWRDLADDVVESRAASMTLVSLACHVPCSVGFCVCTDAGPFLRKDFDLQLTDLGSEFFIDIGTEKGRALTELAPRLFHPAQDAERERRDALAQEALGRFGTETCHFGAAMRRISTHRVAEELWEAMSPWCLDCGGCTHVCPTCYCFSVSDVQEAEGCSTRCRLWDSCQYQAFTLEASGHNPREKRQERIKRRFHHKVSAQYFRRDGRVGCVGCGRCVKACMGTTDMTTVVAAIRHGTWDGGRVHA
jgi:formate hydrogenlyase subunit 6/NADH:ubiquinone oxidoreductase subunit I